MYCAQPSRPQPGYISDSGTINEMDSRKLSLLVNLCTNGSSAAPCAARYQVVGGRIEKKDLTYEVPKELSEELTGLLYTSNGNDPHLASIDREGSLLAVDMSQFQPHSHNAPGIDGIVRVWKINETNACWELYVNQDTPEDTLRAMKTLLV